MSEFKTRIFRWFLFLSTTAVLFLIFLFAHWLAYGLISDYFGAAVICMILLVAINFHLNAHPSHSITVIIIFIFFTFSVPVMNDRSVTLFLLREINKPAGVTPSIIRNEFMDKLIINDLVLRKRIDEQLSAGFVAFEGGTYTTTVKGKVFISIFDLFDFLYR